MATYLLDTTVIIDFLNGKRRRRELLRSLVGQGHMLACCAVNVTEVYAGLRPPEAQKTEAFLRQLDYREVTWEIARQAGLLKNEWGKKGHTLSLGDVTLAATALAYGLVLMTDNTKHFPMTELRRHPTQEIQ